MTDNAIAIIGGGLAGLTSAYYLVKNNFKVILYEGNNRLGGRIYSDKFPNGQTYENGGEFIDSTHDELINLLKEFNLLIDNQKYKNVKMNNMLVYVIDYPDQENKDLEKEYNKIIYTQEEAANDWFNKINPDTKISIFQQLYYDANLIFPINYEYGKTAWPLLYNKKSKKIDKINLEEYINNLTSFLRKDKDGSKTKLAQFIKNFLITQNGCEVNQLSTTNLLEMFYFKSINTKPIEYIPGKVPINLFNFVDESYEKYYIHDGNSILIDKIKEYLIKSKKCIIKMNHRLIKIKYCENESSFDKYNNKPYKLYFKDDTTNNYEIKETYNHVIIAIPFSTMRKDKLFPENYVNLEKSNFSKLKLYAIENLPIGKGSKISMQFEQKFWNNLVKHKYIYINENLYFSRTSNYNTEVITELKGGNNCYSSFSTEHFLNLRNYNSIVKKAVDFILNTLTIIIPNIKKYFSYKYDKNDNKSEKILNIASYCWHHNKWSKGSYSHYGVGQYNGYKNYIDSNFDTDNSNNKDPVSFAGYEGVPEPYNKEQTGNCHFAGEHTSFIYQGYMNGAVESGIRVANKIIFLIKN
jgi:monoamine oxidase